MPTPPRQDKPRSIQAVRTSFSIIEALQEHGSATITELVDHVDVSKGSVYYHLSTLRDLGYVLKRDNEYCLSLLFLHLGKQTQAVNSVYRHGKQVVDDLAEESGEKVLLLVEENGLAFYLYQAHGAKAVGRDFEVGQPDHLHHSAGGKAILAHLSPERVEEIIETKSLPKRTENTITDRDELFDELATVREQGYSLNLEEEVKGVHAVAAPIHGPSDEVLAALTISGPTSRLTEERLRNEMQQLVKNGVNIIEIELNTSRNSSG